MPSTHVAAGDGAGAFGRGALQRAGGGFETAGSGTVALGADVDARASRSVSNSLSRSSELRSAVKVAISARSAAVAPIQLVAWEV